MGTRNSAIQDDIRTNQSTVTSVQIFMPITRAWRVDAAAQMFGKLDQSGYDCELLICIDNAEITEHYVRNAFEKWEIPLKYRIIHTGKYPVGEVNMARRRDRIVEMLTFASKHINNTDFVFMVEDDTEIKPSTLHDLMASYGALEQAGMKVGFVEGVQVGRHGYRMIGAWRCNDLENPTVMETVPYNKKDLLEKIDGGGLYCFVVRTPLFKAHKWYWHHECFSVDVTFGIELRKQGYQNVIDWTVQTGHCQKDALPLYPSDKCVVVRYEVQPEGHWLLMNDRKGYIS